MAVFKDQPEKKEHNALIAGKRWWNAVSGHFMFNVCMGAIHCVSLLPTVVLVYLFWNTKGLVFLAAAILLDGLSGVVWAAIHRMAWELQFGFPTYLFRTFWKHLRTNIRQGWCLGVFFAVMWSLNISPLATAELLGKELPFALVCIMGIFGLLLPVLSACAYYQIGRWQMSLGTVLRNSLLLLINIGPPGVAIIVVWALFAAAILFAGSIVIPACLFCGLTVVICMTTQAFFVPRIDKQMMAASSNK